MTSPETTVAALLLGRAGSVGFAGKNLYPVLGRPLVEYPLRAAAESVHVDRIYVSTDSGQLAEIGRRHGAEIIERPPELAAPEALGEDAFRHGYEVLRDRLASEGRSVELVVLLFANAATITGALIDEGVEILRRMQRRQPEQANHSLAHHNIIFGEAWDRTFTDIIRDGRLMRDPSLLVTRPTASDPSLAPRGHELFYVLAPAPNLDRGVVDWSHLGDSYTEQLIDTVDARLIPGFREGAEVLHIVTPADWAAQGMIAGTPFALAHTFAQTGPFRPANMVRGVDNAVLAGSSTVPGVGVPTAMISGRLAADRVTGIGAHSKQTVITKAGRS